MSEEETSSSSTVDAVEEEVIEEVAEVPASAEDELLKAHEELKKKEGSVSLGKSLARAFRKDGTGDYTHERVHMRRRGRAVSAREAESGRGNYR